MKKLKIEIPVLLPEVAHEQDACVQRLIEQLEGREGIEEIHVENTPPGVKESLLCFHYQPEIIPVARIQALARQVGAELTARFGHMVLEVEGIRHQRHARGVESALEEKSGVLDAEVSGSGVIRLEYDRQLVSKEALYQAIQEQNLGIRSGVVNRAGGKDHAAHAAPSGTSSPKKQEHVHTEGEEHEHKEGEEHEHGHAHGGPFGKNSELIFVLLCGALLGVGWGLTFIDGITSWISLACYIGAYFFGGYYTAKEAIESIAVKRFEIDFLMLIAAMGAAFLGEWAEGALLLFLFSLGHALEHYAMNKAQKSIAALAELAPRTALLKRSGQLDEVSIDQLQVGDVIVVKPNTKIPADGVVVDGKSSVNQAPITGESVPVDKEPVKDPQATFTRQQEVPAQHWVFAGSINGNGSLEIKVQKQASDSTLSRLVKLVNEAQTQKSPTQLFTDRFERIFVPSVLVLVVLLLFAWVVVDEPFSESFYRAMAVLVAASPCALAISTPSAVLSGVARAARGGVLIKGGRPLEDLGVLTAIAFDKTGTLTEGTPRLTHVVPYGSISEEELLRITVAVEQLSDHPLAKAVVRDGLKRFGQPDSGARKVPQAEDLQAVLGKGIQARLNETTVYIGNRALFEELGGAPLPADLNEKAARLEDEGNTTMIIRQDEQYIGVIALMDTPRPEAKATLEKLKKLGIRRMIMLTGDNQKVGNAVAREIGLTDAWGNLLPEQKVASIKELKQQESKVAMVGDGVNDAPAMAHSTVGIAMGAAGSDVALETADIALMADDLTNLPFAIGLSRQSKRIIQQNLWMSLGVTAFLIPATIFGFASIGIAVLIHEGSTLVVVFNALRLLAFRKE
ncbi:heavy metal translocating P-type ATPase [Telluribacter humicola]|uniref:heavy metal translocating P-type ATPase n=1 Tax=Telluribacter humicola TaxID=1720261 RepID=UPI001A96E884|nr:heavy metal translocating P-type ATPase [Telluribacter humicola]